MENNIEIGLATSEVLERVEALRKDIKESMVVGEMGILRGIAFFERYLIRLNPSKIDEQVASDIEHFINRELVNYEYETQHINGFVRQGIIRCFLILESYGRCKGKKRIL